MIDKPVGAEIDKTRKNSIENKSIAKTVVKSENEAQSRTPENLNDAATNESKSSQATAASLEIAQIPGLGPIRIRGLAKAGYDTLKSLREAPIERLIEVPGLTEVQAKQIKEYLEQTPKGADEAIATSERPSKKENASHIIPADSDPNERTARLVTGGTQALVEVINLLLTPQASDFRSRLLRDLSRFAQRTQSLVFDAAYLSPENQERAIRRLRRAGKELGDFSNQALIDRKMQSKLADTLEELCDKLAECGLTPEQQTV